MGNDKEDSFTCYNCNEKNYFDKSKFISSAEKNGAAKTHVVKKVSIECKSCREINSVTIEY
jgi:Ni,Fe-hydrogenase I small subunit